MSDFINEFQFVVSDLNADRRRMSITFAMQTPFAQAPAQYQVNGFPLFGRRLILNPQTVATVAAWDGSRSLQGAIRLGSPDAGASRGLFLISVQGTGQLFFMGSKYTDAAVPNRMEYIDFCVPIFANSNNEIIFYFGNDTDAAATNVFMQGNLNNFELPPYFSQTYQDFP